MPVLNHNKSDFKMTQRNAFNRLTIILLTIILILVNHNLVKSSSPKLSIVVASGHVPQDRSVDPQGSNVIKAVRTNHKIFTKLHNYTHVFYTKLLDPRQAGEWAKVSIIRKLLTDSTNNFDWVLWIDSDAVVVNITRSIEDTLKEFYVHQNTSLIFAGDTCILNTGVLLLKNTPWMHHALDEIWKMGEIFENKPKIGMGYDNAAFAIFLAGCNSRNTYQQLQKCYYIADTGYRNPVDRNSIMQANDTLIKTIISPEVYPYVRAIPHHAFNSYSPDDARFIAHFPGLVRVEKNRRVMEALKK
eukprot:gene9299-19298_t